VSPQPEYDLLLDAVVPLDRPRADLHGWSERRWGDVLSAAAWHRLSPLLYSHLGSMPDTPEAAVSALERAYLAGAARSLFMRAALSRVTDALSAAEVPAMLLKGAALVETVYTDPAHREMLDLDLLVPADRMRQAVAAVRQLGYVAMASADDSAGASGTDIGASVPHHDAPLVADDRLVAVELHRHTTIAGEGIGHDVGALWQRARRAPGSSHLLPAPEHLLVHVCVHFTRNRLGGSARRRHTGGALAQVADIALLVGNEAIDWELVVDTAGDGGLGPRVFLALFAAAELGVQVPQDALGALRPAGFDDLLGRRLVTLRVLRAGDHLPVRPLRWMVAPSREALARGWNADPTATMSLARAYARRARAHVPEAGSALRRPWAFVQDQRLNGQLEALEEAR
jgi:Uncharacterised nucleotidyltransferase